MGAVFSVNAFFISLRESMEICLVVGILLGVLEKTGNSERKKDVWIGSGFGIAVSAVLGIVFGVLKYESESEIFKGPGESIFEGFALATASTLITYMVIWGLKDGNRSANRVQHSATQALGRASRWSLILLSFLEVFKEGIEIALLVIGAAGDAHPWTLPIPALLGLIVSASLAFFLFRGFLRVDMDSFFFCSNLILVLFAAGLCSRAFHEFQMIGWFGEWDDMLKRPWWNLPLWTITNAAPITANDFFSLLKYLFGYSDQPTLVEFATYWGYHCCACLLYFFFHRRAIFLYSSYEPCRARAFFTSTFMLIASTVGVVFSINHSRPFWSWNGALCSCCWILVSLGGIIFSLMPRRRYVLIVASFSMVSFLVCLGFNITDIACGLSPDQWGIRRFFFWLLVFQWDWSIKYTIGVYLTPITLLSITLFLNILLCGGYTVSMIKYYFSFSVLKRKADADLEAGYLDGIQHDIDEEKPKPLHRCTCCSRPPSVGSRASMTSGQGVGVPIVALFSSTASDPHQSVDAGLGVGSYHPEQMSLGPRTECLEDPPPSTCGVTPALAPAAVGAICS